MDILKAELEKKKRKLLESNLIQPNKKYFRNSELKAKEEEEYQKKYGSEKAEKKSEEHLHDNGKTVKDSEGKNVTLSRKEVIRRLRERGEPILLFGETELESFTRLRRCEILEPEINKGLRNDFQEAMEKVDQDFVDELILASHSDPGSSSQEDLKLTNSQVTYDQIQSMATSLGKGDRLHDMEVTMQFLQYLMKMWSNELNSKAGSEKISQKGKLAMAKYTQTQAYLKPLLRKLKSKTLPEDISDSLTEIVKHILDRNYIKANEAYLQMAIGNAPWPIGVTMVGIHARTGREKIFSKNVAHVLNDETQRKYIQALKRLMTKCQEFYPTEPSRCVEYSTES
ncbi:pre-mRNA-splicing factor 18 [Homalodisca vitripennis]|uniref:pre-mRNA-splicing factor 18 n=1 Tax=Homalodisca vitripennis TaxID=197043 RepID=UPI001EE9DA74|nr:pre-mRNA-splicing factor 18 [Homalodisca vitripennis]